MNEILVKDLREDLGLSQERFARLLGVTTRTIQNWESGGVIPQTKREILREIKDGQTAVLIGDQKNIHGDNIAGGNVTVHQTDTDKLLDLLASKEASVAKAQEHIDRLLSIIEKMQQ